MQTDPKDAAFGYEGPDKFSFGLTKLEYFASQALVGLLAKNESGCIDGHAADAVTLAYDLIKKLNEKTWGED